MSTCVALVLPPSLFGTATLEMDRISLAASISPEDEELVDLHDDYVTNSGFDDGEAIL